MLSSLIPKVTDFSDEQIVEAGAKFLNLEAGMLAELVASPQGQYVLAHIRGKAKELEEPESVFHRCPECGFAQEVTPRYIPQKG